MAWYVVKISHAMFFAPSVFHFTRIYYNSNPYGCEFKITVL